MKEAEELFCGLAVQLRLGESNVRDARFVEIFSFLARGGSVNRSLFASTGKDRARLFGKARTDVLEVLLNVVVQPNGNGKRGLLT
jgi:hypothetical protein